MRSPGEPDAIQVPVDVPGWNENLLLAVHDSAAGIGVWAHWSRIPGAPHVWEGLLAVHLPDGTALLSRTFGPAARPADSASSGPLTLRCVEPGRRWRLEFDGMAQRTPTAQLAAGPLRHGPHERLAVSLDFEGLHPLWDAHAAMGHQSWGSAHLEQGGRIRGVVMADGLAGVIDGVGFRDHSYGPRDYAKLMGDTWCTAVFPSGRAILALQVWQVTGPGMILGFVRDGDATHAVRDLAVPQLDLTRNQTEPVEVTLRANCGDIVLRVEPRMPVWWTLDEPVGETPGVVLGENRMVCVETPARITWDGEVADGWLERNLRPSAMG